MQLDALGYNGETSDPLYKHWPFFLGRRRDSGVAYGVYYDTLSEATFDFGQEFDNYHGFYRSTDVADGDLDFYVFAGPDLPGALARFVRLVGGTAMPPRWSLGFANTAMGLVDAPDAQAQPRRVPRAREDRAHSAVGIPLRLRLHEPRQAPLRVHVESRQVSRSAARRPRGSAPRVSSSSPTSSPVFSTTIRRSPTCVRRAVSWATASGAPCLDQFWDGWGAHLDFTHPAGIAWWQRGLATQILDYGIDAAWNDNNEFEIWDEDGRSHGFGRPMPDRALAAAARAADDARELGDAGRAQLRASASIR